VPPPRRWNGGPPHFTESPKAMNSEEIYNVLLAEPRNIEGRTWHGFSYQMQRDSETGEVEVVEVGWPTRLTLWTTDGPVLEDLDEATVKAAIEAALPVDTSYVIPPPPVPFVETFTAEQAVAKYFSAYQIAALQELRMALAQAGKPLGPKMTAAKQWLEGVMLAWAASPTPAPAESFGQPQASFAEASAEAVADLSSQ
jgi:hypothetical protein